MFEHNRDEELEQKKQECCKAGMDCMRVSLVPLVLFFFLYENKIWIFRIMPEKLFWAIQIFLTVAFVVGAVTYAMPWIFKIKGILENFE